MLSKSICLPKDKFVRSLIIALTLACITSTIVGCTSSEESAKIELPRMLAYLPPLPEQPGLDEVAVSFSNMAELKQLHGFAEDITFDDVPTSMMPGFLEVVESAGICASLDAYIQASRTQMDIGYDVMVVKRCIEGGGVTLMEGDFDLQHVAASLENLGYDVDKYEGITTYHFNAENYTGDEAGRELAKMAGHVAVLKGAVITAATSERLHVALDTWAGRTDNLSSVSQYAALAQALGPAVSARFLPRGDRLVGIAYQEITITEKESVFYPIHWPPPSRDTPPNWWDTRETTYQERYIVLASTYVTPKEAKAEGKELVENLETHSLAHCWRAIGEPTITNFEDGAILTIAVALKDDTPGGVPEEMILVWP